MKTISSKVNQKEFEAITEFANMCGVTTSNLIRKVLLHHATFQGGFEYTNAYDIEWIPESVSDVELRNVHMKEKHKKSPYRCTI